MKAADGQRKHLPVLCANRVVDWFLSGEIDASLAEHFIEMLREGALRCDLGETEIAKTIASSMKKGWGNDSGNFSDYNEAIKAQGRNHHGASARDRNP